MIVASCRSAIRLTIARPRPLPETSVRAGRRRAIEAIEDALALADGDARARIADCDHHVGGLVFDRHVDAAARGRVAHRVVDEVREERAQRVRVAVDSGRRRAELVGGRAGHAEIDAARRGNGRLVCHGAPGEFRQVDRREGALRHAGLLARQRQQLLDEMRRAGESRLQRDQRGVPVGVGGGALGELRLQMHGGERRAQLMRRVGDERALRIERTVEAGEQSVQRLRERPDLVGQAGLVDRLESAGDALGDGRSEPRERRKTARHAIPDEERQQRRHDEQGHDRPQRHAGRELAPRAHRLRHLHDLVAGERAEDTPVAIGRRHGVEAELRVLRQRLLRLRNEALDAVAVPDLHDQRLTADRESARRAGERNADERRGHLPQLIVEYFVGFLPRADVRRERGRGNRDDKAAREPHEEPAPDGSHVPDPAAASARTIVQPTPRTLRIVSGGSLRRSACKCTSTALLPTSSFQP